MMKKLLLCWSLALGAILSLCAAEKPAFVLATNGVAQAVVVTSPDAPPAMKETAHMLASYLGRLSGSTFMATEKPIPGFKTIRLEKPYASKTPEELNIRVADANTLILTGSDLLGVRYAAQELIEYFGVVFCSAAYEYVPQLAGLALPADFKRVDAPFMTGRSVDPIMVAERGAKDHPLKLRINLANYYPKIREYGGKVELRYGSNHYYKRFPEHHAYTKKGERTNRYFFCPSDEALYPKLIAAVEEDILKGHKMISLGIDDYGYQCHCEPCQKMIHVVNEEYPNGRDFPAIQNIVLANRVARHFKDKYPDVVFSILAYWDFHVAPPPTSIMLEPNVGVGLALLWHNYGRPVSACERSVLQHDDWAKLFPPNATGALYMWDYYANFRTFIQPYPNLDTMAQNFRHYKKLGVKMTRPQMQFSNVGDLPDLHFWLLTKFAWNPDADYETLLNTWLTASYGKQAAKYVREYIELIEHARDRNFGVWIGCYHQNTDQWLTAEDAVRAFNLWERAYNAVGRDYARRRHLNESRLSVLTLALIRYGDMAVAAKKLNIRLPPREKILADWRGIIATADAHGRSTFMAEGAYLGPGVGFEKFFTDLQKVPAAVTNFKKTKRSHVFTAADMTGAKKMQKMKDPDGTEFARLSVKLAGEEEDIWMNRHYSEVGVTLGKEHEGEWYVFATVRSGTTVPYDRGSSYVGIYRPSRIAPHKLEISGDMEIAAMPVEWRKDEKGWRTICLGKYPLCERTRIWMMNGILHATDFADVKSFTLVDPTLIEGAEKPYLTDSRSTILGARQLKGAEKKRFETKREKYDNYEFARLADPKKATAIEAVIGKDDAGERDVFALVRIQSDVLFDPEAAKFELLSAAGETKATAIIKSEYGNFSWQLIHLGRQTLAEGEVLRFTPTWKSELKAADVRAFVMTKPEVMATGAPLIDKVWDVVIYGSSPAAFTAAIEAQSHGKSAIIVSPETRLGGLTTGGLGATDIGHKSAYGGLALKFYQDVATYYKNPKAWKYQAASDYKTPSGQNPGDSDSMWTFEPHVALNILTKWEKDHQLKVLRGERLDREPDGVLKDGSRIKAFRTLSGKVIAGKTFVDATYEGDLMAAAGVSYIVGREPNSRYGETLNGIQRARAIHHQINKGVDPYVVKGDPKSGLLPGLEPDVADPDGSGDKRVQAYCFRMCLTDDPKNKIAFRRPRNYRESNYELLLRNLEALDPAEVAKNPRRYTPLGSVRMPNRKTDTNNCHGFASDFIGQNYDWAEGSYEEREEILMKHLEYQQGFVWTLANHKRIPEPIRAEAAKWGTCRDEFRDGFGNGWQRQLYVREARRMIGDTVMIEAHCRHEKKAARPVAMGSYPMDSHHVRRYVDKDGFARNEGDVQVRTKGPYGIDYGAIVPKKAECSNLFVPVCLSASHIAFGSIRMEPVFFALGQSAGAAAALAIDANCAVQDVDYAKLRAALDAKGQVVELKQK